MEYSFLGQFLISIRLRRNLTEVEVAERADIQLQDYLLMERDPQTMRVTYLRRVLTAVGIDSREEALLKRILELLNKKRNRSGDFTLHGRNVVPLRSPHHRTKARPSKRRVT